MSCLLPVDSTTECPEIFINKDFLSVVANEIHISNLPNGVTESELKELFSEVGTIIRITVQNNVAENNAYAFLQFKRTEEADRAVSHYDEFEFAPGRFIKVEFSYDRRSFVVENCTVSAADLKSIIREHSAESFSINDCGSEGKFCLTFSTNDEAMKIRKEMILEKILVNGVPLFPQKTKFIKDTSSPSKRLKKELSEDQICKVGPFLFDAAVNFYREEKDVMPCDDEIVKYIYNTYGISFEALMSTVNRGPSKKKHLHI